MRTVSSSVAIVASCVILDLSYSTEAHAAEACIAAVKAACGDVKPRSASLNACLEEHQAKLAGPCASKLSEAAEAAMTCEPDVKRLCGDVQRAADLVDCLEPRLGEMSESCKRALVRVAIPIPIPFLD